MAKHTSGIIAEFDTPTGIVRLDTTEQNTGDPITRHPVAETQRILVDYPTQYLPVLVRNLAHTPRSPRQALTHLKVILAAIVAVLVLAALLIALGVYGWHSFIHSGFLLLPNHGAPSLTSTGQPG